MEQNEIPGRSPFYFPALWIYPKGEDKEQNVLEYDGEDTIEAFKQFLDRRKVAIERKPGTAEQSDL